MNKFEIGSRVLVVGPDLHGFTGVVGLAFPLSIGVEAYSVDLDQHQDPEFDMKGLYFEADELEVV
jgi:hypothetical protein